MPKKIEIRCDHCDRDLTTTGTSVDYRMVLKAEGISSGGGFEMYFCGWHCLEPWMRARLTGVSSDA